MRWGSPSSQPSCAGCTAQGRTFCKLTGRPQLGCPAEAPSASGIAGRAARTPTRTWRCEPGWRSCHQKGFQWQELALSISQAVSCDPTSFRAMVFIGTRESTSLYQHTDSTGGRLCASAPPCCAYSPYSGSLTNSDGSLGKLIPQGLLALTRN